MLTEEIFFYGYVIVYKGKTSTLTVMQQTVTLHTETKLQQSLQKKPD